MWCPDEQGLKPSLFAERWADIFIADSASTRL
jgi:hypothetical protein